MPYPEIPTFWVDATDRVRASLRRYSSGSDCPVNGYHNAQTPIGELPAVLIEGGLHRGPDVDEYEGDARWPTHCACGYEFADDDEWQVFTKRLYRAADGREWGTDELPPGAMYDASWFPDNWKGPDGIGLVVILPNRHPWYVDHEASNCTRKGEDHKCWVRSGDPRTGKITVGKEGNTCSAGAGSILAADYHGFLVNGTLTPG